MIFPEGTITNGEYMLRFKRGAFSTILPIKPFVIDNLSMCKNYNMTVGAGDMLIHSIIANCYLYHDIRLIELPIVFPNENMFKYHDLHYTPKKEKWEAYAEVMREIMCKANGITPSEMTLRDSRDYDNILNGRKVKVTKEE